MTTVCPICEEEVVGGDGLFVDVDFKLDAIKGDANQEGRQEALAEVERLSNFAYPCIASNIENPACPHEDSWTACFLEAFRKWAKEASK